MSFSNKKLGRSLLGVLAVFSFFLMSPFFVNSAYAQATESIVDLESYFSRFQKDASALNITTYNQYNLRFLEKYGEYSDLTVENKTFEGDPGILKVTSMYENKVLGLVPVRTQTVPDNVFLEITSPVGEIYWKRLEAENVFYLRDSGVYTVKLVDIRANDLNGKNIAPRGKDMTLLFEKVKLTPVGSIWFAQESGEIFSQELNTYLKGGGTVIQYTALLETETYKVEESGKGQTIYLSTSIQDLSEKERVSLLSSIEKRNNFSDDESSLNIILIVVGITVLLLVVFMPVPQIDFKPKREIHVLHKMLKIFGVEPFKLDNFVVFLVLIFGGIILTMTFTPLLFLQNNGNEYEKDDKWVNLHSNAFYKIFLPPGPRSEVYLAAEFITDSPIYANVYIPSKTFVRNVALIKVPGVDLDEKFREIPGQQLGTSYQMYQSATSTKLTDYTIDQTTLNMDEFINREIVSGTFLDDKFKSYKDKLGSTNLTLDLYGLDSVNAFMRVQGVENVPLEMKIKIMPLPTDQDGSVGGRITIYDISKKIKVQESSLMEGENTLAVALAQGNYYVDVNTYNSEIREIKIDSKSAGTFAFDWRLTGRKEEIYSYKCGDKYTLVKYSWFAGINRVDDCLRSSLLEERNELTDMYTTNIFNIFLDTVPNVSTDILVTNRKLYFGANQVWHTLEIYDSYPGKFPFNSEFSFSNLMIKEK